MAAWKRGFCRNKAARRVEPERGSPEIKCNFWLIIVSWGLEKGYSVIKKSRFANTQKENLQSHKDGGLIAEKSLNILQRVD